MTGNNTITDKYFLGEPALSILIEAEGQSILFDTGYFDVFLKKFHILKSVDFTGFSLHKKPYIVWR